MATSGEMVDQEQFRVVFNGLEKTFDNAECLFREAEILAKKGAVARAVLLHQISLEECSKADTLGAWAIALIVGQHVDQNKVLNAMRNHKVKNKSNAYMLGIADAERDARNRGDNARAQEEFKKIQKDFHERSNNIKNASLYVDLVKGEFLSPKEFVTNEMLTDIKKRNYEFLTNTHAALKMLQRLKMSRSDMTEMQYLPIDFVAQMENLRDEKHDRSGEAINALIANFVDSASKKLVRKT